MAAKLVAEDGALKGLVLSLEDGDQWIIGRDPDACQLLVEDPSASRKHLVCRTSPQGILVENLSQTNPTAVNDEELKLPRLLHNGDAVKIGDGIFRFYADAAAQLIKEATTDTPVVTNQETAQPKNAEASAEAAVAVNVAANQAAAGVVSEHAPEDQAPEDQAPEADTPEEHAPEENKEHAPEEHALEEHADEAHTPAEQADEAPADSEAQTPNDKAPAPDKEHNEHDEEQDMKALEKAPEEEPALKDEATPGDQQDEATPGDQPVEDTAIETAKASPDETPPAEAAAKTTAEAPPETAQNPAPAPDAAPDATAEAPSEATPEPTADVAAQAAADIAPEATYEAAPEAAEERHDTIFDEEPSDKNALAEINFGLLDTGRWLLKVIGGPNNGAEFSMQAGSSYVIGTDPNACDIVFHDTSVSRQHARITVTQDETLSIEDLKSRNGTIVDGEPLNGKRPLNTNMLISVGTTSFIVFDREGEMQTIISPLMPALVKTLQVDEPKAAPAATAATIEPEAAAPPPVAAVPAAAPAKPEAHHHTTLGAFILIGILTGLFVIVGIGTTTLFKSEPVAVTETINPDQALDSALAGFPSVKYTYNKNTGQLLLVGHVATPTDRSQLLYALQGLKFIKNLDDSGLVIDEYVWREINQVIEKIPEWKGISIVATQPGHFVVSGYLKTHSQADRLSDYLSANFPYPDLLEKRIVVDEEVVGSITSLMQNHGLKNITVKFENGELTLAGGIPLGKEADFNSLLTEIKTTRGVRSIRNLATQMATEQSIINISDKYEVSGVSNQAGKLSVVINGRILMKGDALDGMNITSIQPSSVMLEKEGVKYRIDFNR